MREAFSFVDSFALSLRAAWREPPFFKSLSNACVAPFLRSASAPNARITSIVGLTACATCCSAKKLSRYPSQPIRRKEAQDCSARREETAERRPRVCANPSSSEICQDTKPVTPSALSEPAGPPETGEMLGERDSADGRERLNRLPRTTSGPGIPKWLTLTTSSSSIKSCAGTMICVGGSEIRPDRDLKALFGVRLVTVMPESGGESDDTFSSVSEFFAEVTLDTTAKGANKSPIEFELAALKRSLLAAKPSSIRLVCELSLCRLIRVNSGPTTSGPDMPSGRGRSASAVLVESPMLVFKRIASASTMLALSRSTSASISGLTGFGVKVIGAPDIENRLAPLKAFESSAELPPPTPTS
mmetsp:Transcript_35184/g.87737  ORF Transcript_35184/g.87737 Transcript_35184/m.87737 type:complete len:358 (-) Transcript_35184:578-1651(-)